MPKLNRDGVNIYYEVHGSGPVLLLTHGYSATAQMWKGNIEALSKKHMLVTWDMRGHGQSDYPADPSEEATIADIAAILDRLAPRKRSSADSRSVATCRLRSTERIPSASARS